MQWTVKCFIASNFLTSVERFIASLLHVFIISFIIYRICLPCRNALKKKVVTCKVIYFGNFKQILNAVALSRRIVVFAYIYMNWKISRYCCMEKSAWTCLMLTRWKETMKRGPEELKLYYFNFS
jgi:hypothetical protein